MIFKWTMPFTFVAAMVRTAWAKLRGYEVLATREHQYFREAICQDCPLFDGEQCGECGCLVMAKTALNTEKCPLNKWPRIWRKKRLARQA